MKIPNSDWLSRLDETKLDDFWQRGANKLRFQREARLFGHSLQVQSNQEGVLTAVPDNAILTGHPINRLPHNASFAFRHLSGNDLLMHLDMAGIAASSGSACKSGDPKPSAVLEALGLGREWAKGGLRLTVGRHNTMDEIEQVVATLPRLVAKLQKIHVMFA